MSIRGKLGLIKELQRTGREKRSPRETLPIYTEIRSQSMRSLYSYKDFLIDLIRHCMIKQRVYHPHIPALIVKFVPIYTWSNPLIHLDDLDHQDAKVEEVMKVTLSHCNTVVCNGFQKFGAVLGSKLDPRLDHVINIQLVEGVEFGVGICDKTQLKKNARRDFMCIAGGYGYYNYKTKSARMKPKYPPGLYYQVQTCRKTINEADICRAGDVLTMVIQRETVKFPGGGVHFRSRLGSDRDLGVDPMGNLEEAARYTLSFYKNGEDMGFHLRNLVGPFYMCLNYYFVESKLRVLSDYNFRKKQQHWVRIQSRRVSENDPSARSNLRSGSYSYQTKAISRIL